MATIGDFDPLNSTVPATKIEITVSCRNLLDMDTFSKSDPVSLKFHRILVTKGFKERKSQDDITVSGGGVVERSRNMMGLSVRIAITMGKGGEGKGGLGNRVRKTAKGRGEKEVRGKEER
ncbi:Copine-5 [Liparis tanakae]|uniref:Copine-5 n=1 Tax=Liparis tanakae TaxID=230148 RepID=A0A4Z2IPE0_9TELE|nr:Copine-5 [Liparis tanakae]